MGYNLFNWTTRNVNQKLGYFPLPSIRATPIHSRHLYFPPVSTFGLVEHECSYSLKVQFILNLATYFIFPLHRPSFYYSLCKLRCKLILFFMKIGSTNKYETLKETLVWFRNCVTAFHPTFSTSTMHPVKRFAKKKNYQTPLKCTIFFLVSQVYLILS